MGELSYVELYEFLQSRIILSVQGKNTFPPLIWIDFNAEAQDVDVLYCFINL